MRRSLQLRVLYVMLISSDLDEVCIIMWIVGFVRVHGIAGVSAESQAGVS